MLKCANTPILCTTEKQKFQQNYVKVPKKKAEVFISFVCHAAHIDCCNHNLYQFLYQSRFQKNMNQ